MTIALSQIVPIIIVFQSALFAFVLLTDRGPKRASNRLLAAFLVVLALQFFNILYLELLAAPEWMATAQCVFGFAYGPLLYFYSLSLIYDDFAVKRMDLLHALPFAIFMLAAMLGYAICYPFGSLLYVSLIIYVALAIRKILLYRRVILQTRSQHDLAELRWLQWTMIIFSCTLLLDIVDHFLVDITLQWGISVVYLNILLLVNWMFYKGLKQPQLFLGISEADQSLVMDKPEPLSEDEDAPADLDRIRQYFATEQPFTDPQLSLQGLARQLNLPPRRLSFLINRHFGQNFMSFINHHRIELAKERLLHPKDSGETILEVMYEVGFNSKSSFNTLFKKETGLTPSQFRKSYRQA